MPAARQIASNSWRTLARFHGVPLRGRKHEFGIFDRPGLGRQLDFGDTAALGSQDFNRRSRKADGAKAGVVLEIVDESCLAAVQAHGATHREGTGVEVDGVPAQPKRFPGS